MADKPFIIACGYINVKVLGTSFSLKTSSNNIELKVFTGKVNLSSPKDAAGMDVLRDQKVIYSLSGKNETAVLPIDEKTRMMVHTEYNMDFENTLMQEVIERIENKFDVHITAGEALALKGYHVFATMRKTRNRNAEVARDLKKWALDKKLNFTVVELEVT